MRRWLVSLLVLLVVGFAVLNVVAYNQAYAMSHFSQGGARTDKPEMLSFTDRLKVLVTGVNLPRPATRRSPDALAPDCKELVISEGDSLRLSTWYVDHGGQTPLAIFFHGYEAEKSSEIGEARVFLNMGFSVLLLDFRGSGGSSEAYTTIGVKEGDDVATVVQYVREHLQHPKIVLCGQSMGAASILRAVHEHGIRPDAVVIEAVFDTMLSTVRNRFHAMGVPAFPCAELLVFWGGRQWDFNGFTHNPVDYARSLTCPALFMHGADDRRARLSEGRRVYEAASGRKEFKEFNHTGHESYLKTHPDEWQRTVQDFIAGVVGKS